MTIRRRYCGGRIRNQRTEGFASINGASTNGTAFFRLGMRFSM